MSDLEIKVRVLGYHIEEGELVSAIAAKEVIAHFQSELAKANKRVAELEQERDSAWLHVLYGNKSDVKIEDIKANINKFAIEQKVEGVKWFSEQYCDDEHWFLADKAIEQLHKEQE